MRFEIPAYLQTYLGDHWETYKRINVLAATAYFAATIVLFLVQRGSVKKVSRIVRLVNPCVGV